MRTLNARAWPQAHPRTGIALTALALALALSACAPLLPPLSQEEAEARPSEAPARLKPMPVRAFDAHANCHFRDEAGYTVKIDLDVVQSELKTFSAAVTVPHRGSCHFDGAFVQTRRLPSVELRARDGCTVNIWEQGEQITVGFANCARRCSRGTFDYVWPILIDRSNGACH